jgi:uroporphyrin-III C-methyltransferase
MGLSTATQIAARLIGAGRAASTPAVVIENAGLPGARRVLTSLGQLGEATRALDGPAILIVGEVAALADVSSPAAFETISWTDAARERS